MSKGSQDRLVLSGRAVLVTSCFRGSHSSSTGVCRTVTCHQKRSPVWPSIKPLVHASLRTSYLMARVVRRVGLVVQALRIRVRICPIPVLPTRRRTRTVTVNGNFGSAPPEGVSVFCIADPGADVVVIQTQTWAIKSESYSDQSLGALP